MRAAIVIALLGVAHTPAASAATERVQTSTAWTREVREAEPSGIDPVRRVLELPADVVEVAFSPLSPLVVALERWKLHDRLFDLLTNEELTLAIVPLVDVFSSSGPGAGAALIQNAPLGSADRLVVLALARTNRDVNASLSLNRRLPRLNGREYSVGLSYGLDHDLEYYGLGGDSSASVVRLLEVESIDLRASLLLLRPDLDWNIRPEVAFRSRRLASGTGELPAFRPGESLEAPSGFGKNLEYPELTVRIYYDSRDSFGRTTSGAVAYVEGSASNDLNGAQTGALRTTGSVSVFLPLLPLNRVLFLSAGLSLATPLGDAGAPLHQLVQLGGSTTLRGYESGRFIDRLGWWSTVEYRWHLYEYADSGSGLSAVLFADFGQVGPNPEAMFQSTFHWSAGVSLRAETDLFLLGRLQLAYSPDGFRISLGIGEVL